MTVCECVSVVFAGVIGAPGVVTLVVTLISVIRDVV